MASIKFSVIRDATKAEASEGAEAEVNGAVVAIAGMVVDVDVATATPVCPRVVVAVTMKPKAIKAYFTY